jgi:polyisoprenoid-binding protein YceI
MKQPEFPKIAFKLGELTPKSGDRKAGSPIAFNAKGELTIAGVAKKIEMPVTVEKLEDNKLKVVGSTPLKMTDYGIKPPAPTIALGLIKVGDDIKISFEWIVQQKGEAGK